MQTFDIESIFTQIMISNKQTCHDARRASVRARTGMCVCPCSICTPLFGCIVGNTWWVKLASQCFFHFTHPLYVPFRTSKWQNIMRCTQRRCKLTVVVLLFTGVTYNTRVLSHCYSSTTRNIIYRSTHICRMRLIILKTTMNYCVGAWW